MSQAFPAVLTASGVDVENWQGSMQNGGSAVPERVVLARWITDVEKGPDIFSHAGS